MPKIALLSNVNMNMVIRMLQKSAEVWQPEGYGNELGILMNPQSSYQSFGAEYTFLVLDLMELLEHDLDEKAAEPRMGAWFADLESALKPERMYYISDACLWGFELAVLVDQGKKALLEGLWQKQLEALCKDHGNVRILPYRGLIGTLGEENAFSLKMWYMGKVLLSNEAQRRLGSLILDRLRIEMRTPKKVLVLDLDNTLWGGLAGEHDITPIKLSEDHGGLAYKNLQRVILQMQRQGVLLAIVSKNNEQDAMEILEEHPHMVLKPGDFAAKRINWKPKHENIREIAEELNLGTDSFVFWDDNPSERQLIRDMLPEVSVPEFPEKPEELAPAMTEIYRQFFAAAAVTEEDAGKTAQYAANAARRELEQISGSFTEYLKSLEITITRVRPEKQVERLTQLANKTNQFNLTTKRYTRGEMALLLKEPEKRVYLYQVTDRFGDSGIVAAAVVDLIGSGAVIEEFVMSCRVMGKNVEYGIMDDIEEDLYHAGCDRVIGIYIPTAKNRPGEQLYGQLGYHPVELSEEEKMAFNIGGQLKEEGAVCYGLSLAERPGRIYEARMEREV